MDLIVFQQTGSAETKVKGIVRYGHDIKIKETISIDESFGEIIENPEDYIPSNFEGDLVLNFLKHPDLSDYLVTMCVDRQIPVVTTGKQGRGFTPFTCCGLGRSEALGSYGNQFGFPEYSVEILDGKISHIKVERGAPCGATWEAIVGIVGLEIEDAMTKLPLKVQQNCFANPAAFDPISGKSSVHYAGYVHIAALKKAVLDAEKQKREE